MAAASVSPKNRNAPSARSEIFARFLGRRKRKGGVKILIAGATENLGSLLTKHLLSSPHQLRLLTHKRALPFDLPPGTNAEIVRGDLNDPASLRTVCKNI